MRALHTIILVVLSLMCCNTAEAQILKKLRKKAEKAAERTILRKTDEAVSKQTEKTIDEVTGKKDQGEPIGMEGENPALNIRTEAKKSFYSEDVVIKMHENDALTQTQYFDAAQVAVRMEQDNQPRSGYMDSEGFIYVFNESEQQYNKSSLVALQSQGMMIPLMMLESYKLPPEPFMANLERQTDQGMTANPFNGMVEFAFVYKPEQFRYEDFKESEQMIRGVAHTRFDFLNEPGYEGSYVLFDDKGRLVEIYTNKSSAGESQDVMETDMLPSGKSLILYEYKPVEVQLPAAKEVKAQGQELMEMVMGSFGKGEKGDTPDRDYDTGNSKGQVKLMRKTLKDHNVTADMLPSAYDFDWQYKTTLVMDSRPKDPMDINFLLRKNAKYQGSEITDRKNKDMGKVTMVFDSDLKTMALFMDGQGDQKILQLFPVPEVKESKADVDFSITEIPSKTILGYPCKGLKMENNEYVLQVYHAADAPVSLSNFFSFSGNKKMSLPDIDPRITKQFSGGLIMEMQVSDKKKAKNSFMITARALNKVSTSIKKDDYQVMDFFGSSKMLKN
ncbi:hypothetical protein MQE36_04325 [Zhouia spongiae]|uniref:DUF4412 domain-containing protein n=1 Tax=Zhouia spongiae TaxID=2202721 RepID=A0ABY3YP23_9FLAO|nr:hypothetical protein [Zhouia spongiae]UNY99575.1 hypothetical protein MQE36_04325 [Zhouia spongiae]